MAIFKNTPPIVTNGLTLYLDASNGQSYISGSTTWGDLSGGGKNGTLTGGATYSPVAGGSIDFDGINDWVDLGTSAASLIQGQTSFSIGLMFQLDTNAVLRGLIGTLIYNCGANLGLVSSNGDLSFYNDYGPWPAAGGICYSVGFPNYVTSNTWIYAVATYDGATTSVYGIKNGVLSTTTGTAKSGSTNVFTRNFEIMRGGSYFSDGRVANAFVYNRVLTPQEILQNYNATKTRFNLT